jgi:hypothetical protein
MNVVNLEDYSRGYATEDEINRIKLKIALLFSAAMSETQKEMRALNDNLPFYIDTLDFFACVQDNIVDLQKKLTKAQEKISGL